jgi:hypothetical protein
MAFSACCTAIFLAGFNVPLALTVLGIRFVPIAKCFYMQAASIFATSLSSIAVVMIALERFIAVVFPIWWAKKFLG